ncbi:uncharacterized protein LOC117723786 [Arvicanthis niloticus]|uniref:uncharacterized protein LOC117723786 n=1 Tax=Arvicanthis niloticus TaxID=61156 RepID=UPI00402BCC23
MKKPNVLQPKQLTMGFQGSNWQKRELKQHGKQGVVAYICKCSTQEAASGTSAQIQGYRKHQEHKFSYLKMSGSMLYQSRTSFCFECLQKHQPVSILMDSEMGKEGTGVILKGLKPSFHLRSSQAASEAAL